MNVDRERESSKEKEPKEAVAKRTEAFSFVIVSHVTPIFRIMFPRRHENCTPTASKNGALDSTIETDVANVRQGISYSYKETRTSLAF